MGDRDKTEYQLPGTDGELKNVVLSGTDGGPAETRTAEQVLDAVNKGQAQIESTRQTPLQVVSALGNMALGRITEAFSPPIHQNPATA